MDDINFIICLLSWQELHTDGLGNTSGACPLPTYLSLRIGAAIYHQIYSHLHQDFDLVDTSTKKFQRKLKRGRLKREEINKRVGKCRFSPPQAPLKLKIMSNSKALDHFPVQNSAHFQLTATWSSY